MKIALLAAALVLSAGVYWLSLSGSSAPAPRFLVISSAIRQSISFAEDRALDLAISLKKSAQNVVFLSQARPTGDAAMRAISRGVEFASAEGAFAVDELIQNGQFAAAFVHAPPTSAGTDVAAAHISSLRALSPTTRIAVVFNDVIHAGRVDDRKSDVNSLDVVYLCKQADVVLTASEADTQFVAARIGSPSSVFTLHFTPSLGKRADVMTSFEHRQRGIVVLAENSQESANWFFNHVYPEFASLRMNDVSVSVVGDAVLTGLPANVKSVANEDSAVRSAVAANRVVVSLGSLSGVWLGLATGVPVVTTHSAAAPFSMDDSPVSVAEDAFDMVARIHELVNNAADWEEQSLKGFTFAMQQSRSGQFDRDVSDAVAALSSEKLFSAAFDASVVVAPLVLKQQRQTISNAQTNAHTHSGNRLRATESWMKEHADDWILMSGTGVSSSSTGEAAPAPAAASSSSDNHAGAIAGGVVGGVAGAALLIVLVWFFFFRPKKPEVNSAAAPAGDTQLGVIPSPVSAQPVASVAAADPAATSTATTTSAPAPAPAPAATATAQTALPASATVADPPSPTSQPSVSVSVSAPAPAPAAAPAAVGAVGTAAPTTGGVTIHI